MELVSSAENSTLHWRREYGYLQDIHDGRGYTGGLIGFCSGTGDMLMLVRAYARAEPDAAPLGALRPGAARASTAPPRTAVSDGRSCTPGTSPPGDPVFRRLQMRELDRDLLRPRRAPRARPTAWARSASSSTTTRS